MRKEEELRIDDVRPVIETPTQFIQDYVSTIQLAGRGASVWAQAMVFYINDPITSQVAEEWIRAKERGANVSLVIDCYSRRNIDEEFDLFAPVSPEEAERYEYYYDRAMRQEKQLEQMQKQGISVTYTNPYKNRNAPLRMSRNHMKSYGVMTPDFQAGWLGGINFSDESFSYGDYAVKFREPKVVRAMHSVVEDVKQGRLKKDRVIECTSDVNLLVDAGQAHGQSLIMAKAHELIDRKDIASIQLTSQFPLDPRMLLSMYNKSQNGVNVEIVFSHSRDEFFSQGSGKFLHMANKFARKNSSNMHMYHYKDKLHAKLMIVKLQNGKTVMMTGSHNFFMLGPMLKTAEIQVMSTDQELNDDGSSAFYKLASSSQETNIPY